MKYIKIQNPSLHNKMPYDVEYMPQIGLFFSDISPYTVHLYFRSCLEQDQATH